jgi:hypothetical protein
MKDTKLNNLLGMEDYSEKELLKKAKATKRTEVAKDVLMENTGKDVIATEKMKGKEIIVSKELNNLINLDDFTKSVPATDAKKTKRTEVAKDILEKKKAACCEDDDEEEEKEEKPKGLTAAQKKLPEGLQKAILKRQKK